MLKSALIAGCTVLLGAVVALSAYWHLRSECSYKEPIAKIQDGTKPQGANNNSEDTNGTQTNPKTIDEKPRRPAETFEFAVSQLNKIEGSYYTKEEEGGGGEWAHKFVCETKITDFLLALFTLCLVVIGAWQGHQLKRTVDSAERSDKILERAYVTGGPGHRRLVNGIEFGIGFTGMNCGKTPAFTKKIYWGICNINEWALKEKSWPDIPDCESTEWEDALNPQMTRNEIVAAPNAYIPVVGEGEYVCYGKIIYVDIFADEHVTSWKHSVKRDGAKLITEALPGSYSKEWEKA